jgi:hypothetical protein
MAVDKYRITSPTTALFLTAAGHVSEIVPAGAIVNVDSGPFKDNRLVQVRWAERTVMMFIHDIRTRAEKIG